MYGEGEILKNVKQKVDWKKRAATNKTKSGGVVVSYSWRSLTEKSCSVTRVTEASLSHHSDLSSPLSSSSHSYALFKCSVLHGNMWLLYNSKMEKMGQNYEQLSQSELVWTVGGVQGQDFNYRQNSPAASNYTGDQFKSFYRCFGTAEYFLTAWAHAGILPSRWRTRRLSVH